MKNVLLSYEHVGLTRKNFSLKDINLSIRAGFITVLTGSNGAGKTTLMSMLSGENKKYTGRILVCGRDLRKERTQIIERIGYIAERSDFYMQCDAIENEMFFAPNYPAWDKKLYRELLKNMEISTSKPLQNLSRGNYVKFQLAWSMAHHASVYVMDEPTAGLDPIFRREFYKMIQKLVEDGAAVFLSTNLWSDVKQIADYHIEMVDGRILMQEEVKAQ